MNSLMMPLVMLVIVFFPNAIVSQIVESTNRSRVSKTLAFGTLCLISLNVLAAVFERYPPDGLVVRALLITWIVNFIFGQWITLKSEPKASDEKVPEGLLWITFVSVLAITVWRVSPVLQGRL